MNEISTLIRHTKSLIIFGRCACHHFHESTGILRRAFSLLAMSLFVVSDFQFFLYSLSAILPGSSPTNCQLSDLHTSPMRLLWRDVLFLRVDEFYGFRMRGVLFTSPRSPSYTWPTAPRNNWMRDFAEAILRLDDFHCTTCTTSEVRHPITYFGSRSGIWKVTGVDSNRVLHNFLGFLFKNNSENSV